MSEKLLLPGKYVTFHITIDTNENFYYLVYSLDAVHIYRDKAKETFTLYANTPEELKELFIHKIKTSLTSEEFGIGLNKYSNKFLNKLKNTNISLWKTIFNTLRGFYAPTTGTYELAFTTDSLN